MLGPAWAPEIELLRDARSGVHYSIPAVQISPPVLKVGTRATVSLEQTLTATSSLQGSAEAFMSLLGGELRPGTDAETAFASVRAQFSRPAKVVRRRSTPPVARG